MNFMFEWQEQYLTSERSERTVSGIHRCQGFWFVWSEKCHCPEGAIVRPGGPNF